MNKIHFFYFVHSQTSLTKRYERVNGRTEKRKQTFQQPTTKKRQTHEKEE